MPRFSVPYLHRPIIVDPLKEDVEITAFTAKIFPLILTFMQERFAFVYERASFFYRRLKNGRVEKVPKRRGTGFAGGGSKPNETPMEAALREGNEELGVKIDVLKRLIKPDICYTVYAGDQHPFHLFYVAVTEEGFKKGFLNRAAITDWKLEGKMAGWARLRELDQTILAPADKKERELREERGNSWFYYGHQVLLVAMLTRLVKIGVIKGKQEDLPRIVFRQISPIQGFSESMVGMLVRESRGDLLEDRLPRLMHSEYLSRHAASALIHHHEDALVERLIEQADRTWRKKLEERITRMYQVRDSTETPHVFESMEKMMEFNSESEEEQSDDQAPALADSETPKTVYESMEDMVAAISFDENEEE